MHRPSLICCLLVLFTAQLSAQTKAVRVAVASNFLHPVQHLAEIYNQEETTLRFEWVSGASGKLYAQILAGAPYDLFLSADTQKPKALIGSERVLADSYFIYALGRLLLWSGNEFADLSTLIDLSDQKIAIAQPEIAPYGTAALSYLQQVSPSFLSDNRLIMAENVSQIAHFARYKTVDFALLPQSIWLHSAELIGGNAIEIPQHLHLPIKQAGVILKGPMTEEIQAFVAFILSERGQAIIQSLGYAGQHG